MVVLPRQCKAQRLRRQTPPDTLPTPPEVTAAYRGLYNNSVPIDNHYFYQVFYFQTIAAESLFTNNINIELIEDDDPMNRF